MSEMADLQELQRQHHVFAEETFAYLLENFQIESNNFNRYELFQPYIGNAIITISYIFRKDYRKIFRRLLQNLKHIKMFENYCTIVPVKKDKRYFYYFLMRVSLISELSLYCYNEGYNYFKIGQKCVAEYEDLQYFESVGGWGKLAHTALFIASLGRPLTMIMYPDYNDRGKKIQTFHESFSALDKELMHTGNLEMLDSAEVHCLLELDKMFLTQTRKGKNKCSKKEKPEKENEFFEDFKISPKATSHYSKDSSCTIMAEYFKKCLLDLIYSKALGYLMKNFYQEMPNVFNVSSVTDDESLTDFAKSSDPQNSTSHLNGGFSDKKVVYIKKFKATSPVASPERIMQRLEEEQLRAALAIENDSSDLDMPQCDSYSHCSGKMTEIFVKENLPLTESPEKYFPDRLTTTSENIQQNANNYKLDKNIASRKERNPTFIVPDKYFRLKNSGDTSKYKHLYAVKMCPPSSRRKLSEPMKKLLDENIEDQNNSVLPSGDILLCPRESSANDDTLIILAESSSDDEEVDENIDILICLFKKLEIDSLDNVKSYSLRPRRPSLLEKERSRSDLDREESTEEITTSDEESPLKIFRLIKSKQANFVDEKHYAKKLICFYKKYFTSILDEYFNTEFSPVATDRCRKDSEIDQDHSKYVFAATASIMAKRKVLLDEPEETKRLIGIQLYKALFEPQFLPLDVQRELDLQIRKGNYFSTPNGVYGVGPECRIPRENIWVIFFTGNGSSEGIDYSKDDLKEIPNIFRSYEPVLEIFRPLQEDSIKTDMDCFEILLYDLINMGFPVE